MSSLKFSAEQLQAINDEGTNIIVSAGAGSGKTAVLTERIKRKLLQGTKANELLVLTFTNAAAAEMKERVIKKMKEDENLSKRIDEIDGAYITTFDSFAISIVKKYHYVLNLSKNISIINGSALNVYKRKILEEIFNRYYESNDPEFEKLLNDLTTKDDNQIKSNLLAVANKLDLKTNRDEYLNSYIEKNFSEEKINEYIKEYEMILIEKIKFIEKNLQEIEALVDEDTLKSKTIEAYHTALDLLLNRRSYDDIRLNYFPKQKLPNKPKKEEAIVYHNNIADTYKNIEEWLVFTNVAYIKEVYLESKPYLSIIIRILNEFHRRVDEFKLNHECFEFIDIAKFAIRIVKENEDIRNELKESFNEILIDEYQDTNDLQEEFVSYISKNNVYMVGDIKQSIYRFRNANPSIFKNKYDSYRNMQNGIKIDLNKNFRSNNDVITSINMMFNKIMDDEIGNANYQKEHQLAYGFSKYNESPEKSKRISYLTYNWSKELGFKKHQVELFAIKNDILKKIEDKVIVFDKDEGIYRPCEYKDFAILSSKASHFDEAKKIMEYYHIPSVIYKNEEVGNSIVIPLIINIIDLICLDLKQTYNEEFKKNFYGILRSFIFNYTDEKLFDIISNNQFLEDSVYQSIHEIALNASNLSISQLIEEVIYKFNIIDKLVCVGDVNNNLVRIEYLISLARDLEKLNLNMYDFVLYINDIFDNEEKLEFQASGLQENKIKLMTIHKSKGLEFPFVYLIDNYSKFNYDDLKGTILYDNYYGIITPYNQLGVGKNIHFYLSKNRYYLENISEELRLLYVALTRAREFLIILNPLKEDIPASETGIIDSSIRSKYGSFGSIYYSINDYLESYKSSIDIESLNLNNNYNEAIKVSKKELIEKTNKTINYYENHIDFAVLNETHASKLVKQIQEEDTKKAMAFGTHIHEVFESFDLKNPNYSKYSIQETKYLTNFINQPMLKNIKDGKIYKEFEFIYNKENSQIHGIIDLMIVYNDHVDIIDYKLRHVDDENYVNQLKTYQTYIENKLNLKTYTYLYSIMDNQIKNI